MSSKSKPQKTAAKSLVAERMRIPIDKNATPALYRLLSKLPLDRQGVVLMHLANTGLQLELINLQISGVDAILEKIGTKLASVGETSTVETAQAAVPDAAPVKLTPARTSKPKAVKPAVTQEVKQESIDLQKRKDALLNLSEGAGIGLD